MPFGRGGRQPETQTTVVDANVRDVQVAGPLAIGSHITQYVAEGDMVVTHVPPERRPSLRLRDLPVRHLPRDFPSPLGRGAEVRVALDRLQAGGPVELAGPSGIGKTALLRHVSHRVSGDVSRDGVLHTYCGEQQPMDLLQWLFEAFVQTDVRMKATPGQLDEFLRDRQAMVVLDNVAIDRDAVGELADRAPACTFLWAAPRRLLWGEGASLELPVLGEDEALALFEREAGFALPAHDLAFARQLCRAVHGHPFRILQAAALHRRPDRPSLRDLAALTTPEEFDAFREQALSEEERRVLGPLAALPGASLRAGDLGPIANVPSAAALADNLVTLGLAEAHSPRYSLVGVPGPALSAASTVQHFRDRALAHFASRPVPPDELAADLPAVLAVLEHGASAGRWADVLGVVRREERRLAMAGRWEAWRSVLKRGRRAARELDDRRALAWTEHQLGTRALCLGEAGAALTLLQHAAHLRHSLGDRAGATRTDQALQRAREVQRSAGRSGASGGDGRRWGRNARGSDRGAGALARAAWPVAAAAAAGAIGLGAGVAVSKSEHAGTLASGHARTVTGPDRVVTVTTSPPATAATRQACDRLPTRGSSALAPAAGSGNPTPRPGSPGPPPSSQSQEPPQQPVPNPGPATNQAPPAGQGSTSGGSSGRGTGQGTSSQPSQGPATDQGSTSGGSSGRGTGQGTSSPPSTNQAKGSG